MNGVLSTYYPKSTDLITFRQEYSSQVLTLSTQAEQLKPIGAGLVGLYLESAWTANAEKIGPKKISEDTHEVSATARWSTEFCRKLEVSLQPLLGYLPVE